MDDRQLLELIRTARDDHFAAAFFDRPGVWNPGTTTLTKIRTYLHENDVASLDIVGHAVQGLGDKGVEQLRLRFKELQKVATYEQLLSMASTGTLPTGHITPAYPPDEPVEDPTKPPKTKERRCRKRALVVGINQYPTQTRLKGPVPDAIAMRELLIKEFKYPPADVAILTDGEASKTKIMTTLKNLVASLKPGDAGVFYFSGHGGQQADTSFDEDDALDETLIPVDEDPIVDDDIRAALARLPALVNFSVILDSCHSGTATKEAGLGEVKRAKPSQHVKNIRPTVGEPKQHQFINEGASHMLLAASRSDQSAYDAGTGETNSVFTAALLKELKSGRSYAQAFEMVLTAVRARTTSQTPQLEGAGRTRKLFACLNVF